MIYKIQVRYSNGAGIMWRNHFVTVCGDDFASAAKDIAKQYSENPRVKSFTLSHFTLVG